MFNEPGWAWQPDKCWCDLHFIEYMATVKRPANILHVGTGLHHKVGTTLTTHRVLGLTMSNEELQPYVTDIAPDDRYRNYTVLLGDVQWLPLAVLGQFDFITLFHFGELPSRGQDLRHTLFELTYHLTPRGYIIGFCDSAARAVSIPLFDQELKLVDEYKSLRFYQT